MKNYAELLGLDPDGTARELGSSSKGARQGRRREANAGFGSVSLGILQHHPKNPKPHSIQLKQRQHLSLLPLQEQKTKDLKALDNQGFQTLMKTNQRVEAE